MSSAKIYKDADDNECTLLQLVIREPMWAVSRIQEGEKAIEKLQQQKPLTDEEIKTIYSETSNSGWQIKFARAIEKAHGIGDLS